MADPSEQITRAELDVMDALWTQSPQTAAEVVARVAPATGWTDKTVRTLLKRLVDKGVVAHEPDGRRFLYRPLIGRAAYAGEATARLAGRLFDGRVAPLVAHFADAEGLSADDIAELETILDALKRDAGAVRMGVAASLKGGAKKK